MFQLSFKELEILKSQFTISTPRWGGRRPQHTQSHRRQRLCRPGFCQTSRISCHP
ncbi:MAG: hypothetical protein NTY86_10370 [Deltaproteobacteria bacterium]|nr:hypothetical protein [Deltaproteobacteria bacterium]